MLEKLSPGGVFVQASTAGSEDIRRYGELITMRISDMGGDNAHDKALWLYSQLRKSKSKFVAFGYCDNNTNYGTPTQFKEMLAEMDYLAQLRDPDHQYKYLDVNTFVDVVKQSGKGFIYNTGE